MRRAKKSKFQSTKKEKSKTITIILILSGILMTGLVTWIAMNDWDVDKSLKKINSVTDEPEKEAEIEEIPEEFPEPTEVVEPEEPPLKVEPEPAKDDEPIVKEPVVEKPEVAEKSPARIDAGGYIEGQKLPSKPTYVKGILIANKKYPLPSTFAPGEDKKARAAFEEMAAKAALEEFKLTAFSTYRSFDYQKELYERYVNKDGKEAADRYSARPGYSEHQTGLAFDIGEVNFEKHWASSTFGDTAAGEWVAKNAHRFGFVMRYPLGKEKVTGYMHESWHFRYVGPDIATEIYKAKGTLEEHLGI